MFDIANGKYLSQGEIIAAISSVPISMLTHALGLLKGTYSSERRGREKKTSHSTVISKDLLIFHCHCSNSWLSPQFDKSQQKREHPDSQDWLLSVLFCYAKSFYSTIFQKIQCFPNTQRKVFTEMFWISVS